MKGYTVYNLIWLHMRISIGVPGLSGCKMRNRKFIVVTWRLWWSAFAAADIFMKLSFRFRSHYDDVIMSGMAPQISFIIVYQTVYSRRRSKITSKLRVTGRAGNSPVTGEFLAQRASNTENVSIWWRHHDLYLSSKPNGQNTDSIGRASLSKPMPAVYIELFMLHWGKTD